eukprot:708810_1
MEGLNCNVPKFQRMGPRQSKSDQLALFLLRSEFVYTHHPALSHTDCPRMIRLKDGSVMNNIYVAGMRILAATQSMFTTTRRLQALGNELCGAKDGCFDPTDRFYEFALDELELFQLF